MNVEQKANELIKLADRIEKKINKFINEKKTIMSPKQKEGHDLINELDNIISATKSIGFSAEKANEVAFKLGGFRQQIEIFSMHFGVDDPLVKKLKAMTDKVEEQLKQHHSFSYL